MSLRANEPPPPPAPAASLVLGLLRDPKRLLRHVSLSAARAAPPNALAFVVYVHAMDLIQAATPL